jgi:predicted dehydrogenase|tara:strand:+ start:754 stop:948 length:195 start_codon:yes stop_codon:yes gene_type:complete
LAYKPVDIRGGCPRDQFGFLAENVIQCLRGKAEALSTGEDSFKVFDILIAMRENAAQGSRIVLV